MFSLDDHSVCSIGVPSRLKQSKSGKAETGTTHVGGHAVWHNPSSAPKADRIVCYICGSRSSMVLVAQIYAPISFDRSLYVFACNTRACSLQSAGWIVVRNQKNSCDDTSTEVQEAAEISPAAMPISKGSAWDFLASDVAVGPASRNSAWGDFTFGDDACKVDDLEELLKVRDMSLQNNDIQSSTSAQSATAEESCAPPDTFIYTTEHCLPCTIITEEEEYWTSADEKAAWEGLIDSEFGFGATGGSEQQQHIDRLLASYYEGEEDAEIVNLVKQQGKEDKSGKKSSKSATDDSESSAPTAAKPTASKPSAGSAKNNNNYKGAARAGHPASNKTSSGGGSINEDGETDDDDSEAGIDVKLSRSSRRQQVETYFQNRVSYYPTQVLRYAYGGDPLWITHPSPLETTLAATADVRGCVAKEVPAEAAAAAVETEETVFVLPNSAKRDKNSAKSETLLPPAQRGDISGFHPHKKHIPCCEHCGKERVFECQLMPALLSFISTPATPATIPTAPAVAAKGKKTDTSTGTVPTTTTAVVPAEGQPSAADIERFKASLGEGVDYGVVAIYSCPDSCEVVQGVYATEVAIVQAPPDII